MAQNYENDREEQRQKNTGDWTSDPSLAGIDMAKLQMLQSMAANGRGKSQSELMPFLMAASSTSRKRGMQFTPAEMELIVNVLKSGKSSQEAAKIDQMMQIIRRMRK